MPPNTWDFRAWVVVGLALSLHRPHEQVLPATSRAARLRVSVSTPAAGLFVPTRNGVSVPASTAGFPLRTRCRGFQANALTEEFVSFTVLIPGSLYRLDCPCRRFTDISSRFVLVQYA